METNLLGKDVNGNKPSGEGCQWKQTFWGRMSMETYLLGKDVNGNIPSGEGCQWKHTFWGRMSMENTFWGRMSMETYLLGKDVNGNIPSGEGCQWKHTFWGRMLMETYLTMIGIRINVGSLATMKTVIYAAWCHVVSSNNNNFHDHFAQMDPTVSACSK